MSNDTQTPPSTAERHDLWLRACTVFDGLGVGQPALALPAFGGLFDPGQTPHLNAGSLANGSLLRALRALTWVPAGKGLARVNWRDMGAEERVVDVREQIHDGIADADKVKGGGAGRCHGEDEGAQLVTAMLVARMGSSSTSITIE